MTRRLALVSAWLLLLLLVSIAVATRVETVFSIALPYPDALFLSENAVVYGDGLYVACGDGSMVEAVNLTTKSFKWVSANLTSYGYLASFAVTKEVLLLSYSRTLVAISTQNGQQLWEQHGYQLLLNGGAAAFTYGSTVYAQVYLPPPSQQPALQAFDLATGTPGFFQYSIGLQIDGNTAFIAQYSLDNGQIVDSTLRAVDIPTNATLWSVPFSQYPYSPIQAISADYIAISNVSGQRSRADELAVVLHRRNGTVAQSFQAFNGFAYSGVASLHGNMLFAVIGEDNQRYVVADLTTGYILWTRTVAELGYGGIFTGGAVVTMSSSLMLTVSPINSNSPSISIPNVPTLPSATIVGFGFGVVMVGNLQGYTLWDTNTGDFLGSNEQDPNGVLSAPAMWNRLLLVPSGNVFMALQVVS